MSFDKGYQNESNSCYQTDYDILSREVPQVIVFPEPIMHTSSNHGYWYNPFAEETELDQLDYSENPSYYEARWLSNHGNPDLNIQTGNIGFGLSANPDYSEKDAPRVSDASLPLNPPARNGLREEEGGRNTINTSYQHLCTNSRSQNNMNEEDKNVNPSEAPPVRRIGRRPINTGLSQRKDVVLKAVLRKIRTHYWKQFQAVTCFNKHKRSKYSAYYEDCLKKFIVEVFELEPTNQLVFALGSFLSSREMKDLISTRASSFFYSADNEHKYEALSKIDTVHDTLYKFSFAKFKKMIKSIEICRIIMFYSEESAQLPMSDDERTGLEMLLKECRKRAPFL